MGERRSSGARLRGRGRKMVKLTAILILKRNGEVNDPHMCGLASDLTQFGYFERPVVRDMLNFVSRTIVKRTEPGQRQTVEHQEYLCHVFNKVLDDYVEKFGQNWRNHTADTNEGNPILEAALREYQDPSKADNLLRVQKELDETKIVLHKTIDSVLARGEKLDNLVAKSSDLSMASQMFYRTAKKQNQCCKMM